MTLLEQLEIQLRVFVSQTPEYIVLSFLSGLMYLNLWRCFRLILNNRVWQSDSDKLIGKTQLQICILKFTTCFVSIVTLFLLIISIRIIKL